MGGKHLRKAGLVLALVAVFTAVTLLPPLTPPAFADAAAPLPVAEDPMAQMPEQQTPEISIGVDVRDGHLTGRVVDTWGPGRRPFLFRSYTNTQPVAQSAAGQWHLSQILDVRPACATGQICANPLNVREADGTLSVYKSASGNIYTKDVGEYSTLEAVLFYADQLYWTGWYKQYLPKGVVRRFYNQVGTRPLYLYGLGWAGIVDETDANGNVRTYTWDFPAADSIQRYLLKVTDEVGRVTNYSYERSSCPSSCYYRVKSITDPYGRVVTFTYDASGNVSVVQNAARFTTQYTYQSGLLTGVSNARGYATTITWTATTPSRVAKVTAPDATATTYTYDSTAGTTTVTDARIDSTVFSISSVGDIIKTVDSLGNTTTYAYDARHNLTQGNDARGVVTTSSYNTRNKVTQVIRANGTLNLTTTLSWGNNDNLLSVTNPRSITTNCTYDTANNLTSVRRAVGITADEALTQNTYTTWGGVASVIDPRGNTTTFGYTARHQLQTVTPPAGGPTTYGYDAFDNRITVTNGNGRVWTTTYDASRLPPYRNRSVGEWGYLCLRCQRQPEQRDRLEESDDDIHVRLP
jgi:YD repeat-containing protein